MPSNWSIQNTKAIIMFEANKNSREVDAKLQIDKAMSILTNCYKLDKRKAYHALKYAEYALFIVREFGDEQYLKPAEEWLKKEITGRSESNHMTKLLKKVTGEISSCERGELGKQS
jgi:hypothetical protein